jgi:hypothetical protein
LTDPPGCTRVAPQQDALDAVAERKETRQDATTLPRRRSPPFITAAFHGIDAAHLAAHGKRGIRPVKMTVFDSRARRSASKSQRVHSSPSVDAA